MCMLQARIVEIGLEEVVVVLSVNQEAEAGPISSRWNLDFVVFRPPVLEGVIFACQRDLSQSWHVEDDG